jgi:hypothetical protein
MKSFSRAGVCVLAAAAMAALGAGAAGASAPDNFGGESPVILNDYGEHYVNLNNPDLRWDWTCHQFATPGHGDDHANQDHSAVIDRPGESGLVAPGDKSSACT